jgi:spore maturation protein CgeB
VSTLVFLGLSLGSSWGNGHATTYRALLGGLAARGHRVVFLERDVPWYAAHRDMAKPASAELHLYKDEADFLRRFGSLIDTADAVTIGSYVPDGVAIAEAVLARARGPVAFYDIDTPVTLAALAEGRCAHLTPALVSRFEAYFSFAAGPTLRRLERDLGARRALALPCGVDPDLYRPSPEPLRWDLGYLGTYSADRLPALERLVLEPARQRPDLRFVVAGPQYPDEIAWPANVHRIDHLAPADHPRFYATQRWTLNLTRADKVATGWAPSVRLFETPACGTPAISDPWPGLDDVFPIGEAILVADGPETVLAALDAGPDLRASRGPGPRRDAREPYRPP